MLTWTPKVCKKMAFMAIIRDLGLFFTYFWGSGGPEAAQRYVAKGFPQERGYGPMNIRAGHGGGEWGKGVLANPPKSTPNKN